MHWISFGYHNSLDDIDRFIEIFQDISSSKIFDQFQQLNPSKPTVSSLFVYPVKSCGPYQVKEMKIENGIPKFDRIYSIVSDKTGRLLISKQHPRLSMIKVERVNGLFVLQIPTSEHKIRLEEDEATDSQAESDVNCNTRVCLRKVEMKVVYKSDSLVDLSTFSSPSTPGIPQRL